MPRMPTRVAGADDDPLARRVHDSMAVRLARIHRLAAVGLQTNSSSEAAIMRLGRFRVTLSRLMVASAILALMIKASLLWQRSTEFAEVHQKHLSRLETHRIKRDGVYLNPANGRYNFNRKLTLNEEARREIYDRWVQYEEQLVRKYQKAMFFPWMSVEPDPPEPNTVTPRL
jgi:hypothetical protein